MSDITTGYTWSDDKANWENNEATSIRLNKMMDDADVNILAGANVTVTRSSAGITIASSSGAGTVTSVAATVPSIFSIAGSPITTSGTLAMTYSGTALPQANGGTGQTTLGAGTVTTTGTGAVAISLSSRFSQVFNVKDYGALGNGSTNDRTAISNADTDAVAVGGVLFFPAGTYNIATSLTISSPIYFAGSKLLAPASCTITVNGTVNAGLFQVFSWTSTGAYVMGTKVGRCPVQWFGALNDASDSSAAIQKTVDSCDANAVTTVFSGVLYGGDILLSSSISPKRCSIDTNGNAELKRYSGKTNGITIRQIQYSPINLPKLSDFSSGAAIILESANVNNISCQTISACAVGISFNLTSTYTAILDNIIRVTQIDNCTTAAVDIYSSYTSATTQGNEVYVNFSVSNKRHCYWHDNGSATSVNWDSNKFITQAIDANGVSTAYGFHNASSNNRVGACILACETWLGGFNTGTPHFVDGKFDGCEFRLRWNDTPLYAGFTPTPATGTGAAGNRYVTLGGSLQWSSGIAAVATNSRASFNSGNVISGVPNKFLLKCTTSGSTANGAIQNFYCYHPYVDGKCVVYATPYNGMSGCIMNAVADNSSSYANEIWVQLMNVSGVSVPSATDIYIWITVSST